MRFLEEVFSLKSDDSLIQVLWRYPGDHFFARRYEAIDQVARFDEEVSRMVYPPDLYFCCGLARRSDLPRRWAACRQRDIAAVPGIWMDIPLAQSPFQAHRPMSPWKALDLLEPVQPTLAVASRQGVQAYWLFDEMWGLEDAWCRTYFKKLHKTLHTFFHAEAVEKHGWWIDPMLGLTQAMPLPGTTPPCNPRWFTPAEVILFNATRYDPAFLQGLLTSMLETRDVDRIIGSVRRLH